MKTATGSYSEIDCARQCLHKHELAYKERWREPSVGPALARGTLAHEVLAAHYTSLKETQGSGMGDPERLDLCVNAALAVLEEAKRDGADPETVELVGWIYAGYIEYYGTDPHWTILAVETNDLVWLPTATGGRSRFQLKLKADLVVRQDNRIWIVDHKTGKDLPTGKQLDIDDQFGLYTWGYHQLGKDVFGSLHNAMRTQRNKDQTKNPQTLESRMTRTRLTRTPDELDTVAVEAYRTLRRAHSLKIGEAERSPNTDTCRWKCSFTEACLFGRKGLDERRMLADMGFVQDFTRH